MPENLTESCEGRSRDLDASPHRAGEILGGKYRLERLLGEGGMGCVWLARNLDLDSNVAIKLIRSGMPFREAAERMKREARAAARVAHPAIVKVYDVGETTEGHPFIVMEALEGESLASVLENTGPLSPVSAVNLLLPVVDGLAEAHDAGVVHRDIKPENVFLARTPGIEPKLLDFGIAKLDQGDRNDGKITTDGSLLGSPAYMSPEQARGIPDVDRRADIWAICAVLYEAVAGVPPFRAGSNYNEVLRRILEDEIPPLRGPEDGRAALWVVLSHGLEKDRSRRFSSMRALGDALSEFVASHAVAQKTSVKTTGARCSLVPVSVIAENVPDYSPSGLVRSAPSAIRFGGAALLVTALAGALIGALAGLAPGKSAVSNLGRGVAASAEITAATAPRSLGEASRPVTNPSPKEEVLVVPVEERATANKGREARRTGIRSSRPGDAEPRAARRRSRATIMDLKDPYP